MITVEFDMDETLITVLDDTGELEDVSVFMFEDYIHIRQWNEKMQKFDVITMKPEMYLKLMRAWRLPEGSYVMNYE
jgi:hypothetical protein